MMMLTGVASAFSDTSYGGFLVAPRVELTPGLWLLLWFDNWSWIPLIFSVMLIPHSLQVTTWGEKRAGDTVNLEVDVFARYLDRLDSCRRGEG